MQSKHCITNYTLVTLAISKGWNEESENGIRRMMGMLVIRAGMWGIGVEMQGIGVGNAGYGVRYEGNQDENLRT